VKPAHLIPLYALFASTVASHARADASAQDKAVASRLFDDAGKLMKTGHTADACPKYAESQRLDPQLGTLLHLGECYGKLGKTASSWGSFKDAAEIAHGRADPREAKIRARIDTLEKSLSNLTITVADTTADLEVREDGEVVGKALWGSPVPVDPGSHTITAAASGRKAWSGNVTVGGSGATARIEVPMLEVEPAAESAPPSTRPTSAGSQSADSTGSTGSGLADSASHSSTSTQRIAGYSLIGAGAVGIGVGIFFELQRSAKLRDRDAVCPGTICPQEELADDRIKIDQLTSQARSASTAGTVALIAGGALAAAGIVFVLTAPSPTSDVAFAPLLGPGLQGAALSGHF
jgi:hypothetical protein